MLKLMWNNESLIKRLNNNNNNDNNNGIFI